MKWFGPLTPNALGPSARDFSGEFGQAQLRSSIRASHPGMAEGFFLYEVGSAQLTRADLTNNKGWNEVADSVFSRPTKHTLSGSEKPNSFELGIKIAFLKLYYLLMPESLLSKPELR
jgi:hypothetical protein